MQSSSLVFRVLLALTAGLWLTLTAPAVDVRASPSGGGQATFSNPQINGVVVDHCLNWGTNCDQPAADQFCRMKGFAGATGYQTYPHAPTYVIGDRRMCENEYCVGFSQVSCLQTATAPTPPAPPTVAQTYSKWTSITPDRGQFSGQPGGALPLAVLGDVTFRTGQYWIYVAVSDPNGMRISRWNRHGPIALGAEELWKATLLSGTEPSEDLRLERNSAELLRYSTPSAGHAMIYVRNDDPVHWRSICVLPVDGAMKVQPDCFGGRNNVTYAPAGGTATNGSGHSPTSAPTQIFNNSNGDPVDSGPTAATVFTLNGATRITKITTYHWNSGRGAASAGRVSLRDGSGRTYGPWQAAGGPGSGGAPNAYWVVTVDVMLPAGDYEVIDTDVDTWAQNAGSSGAGMAWIDGAAEGGSLSGSAGPGVSSSACDISGQWRGSDGSTFAVSQSGRNYSWTMIGPGYETARGTIDGRSLTLSWSGDIHAQGTATGEAFCDSGGHATRINWSNDTFFTRP
jgi:hypothetical protein